MTASLIFLYTMFHFPFAAVLLSTRYFFSGTHPITSFYRPNLCVHETSRIHQVNFNHSYFRLACFTPTAISRARALTHAHTDTHIFLCLKSYLIDCVPLYVIIQVGVKFVLFSV